MENNNQVEPQTTQNVENNSNESKKLSFDEILQDSEYQREFDKKIAKALDTAKTKWDEEAEAKKTEAERLAKMNADEKNKYALDKETERANKAESELNAYKLKEEASKMADEVGLDRGLLDIIHFEYETADSIKNNIDIINTIFKKAVENALNEKLKEKSPKNVVGNPTENKTISRASY